MGIKSATCYSVSSPSDPGRKYFHQRKNKACLVREECLSLLKSFIAWSFHFSFMASDKNYPFSHLAWKIPNIFMHCLIGTLEYQFLNYGSKWLAGIIVNHTRVSPTDLQVLFFFIRIREASKLLYLHNHNWTQSTLFESSALSSDWHPDTEIFVLEILIWMPSTTESYFQISSALSSDWHPDTEIFVLEILIWMPSTTESYFQISSALSSDWHPDTEILVLEILIWMPSTTESYFQISGLLLNCVMVILPS